MKKDRKDTKEGATKADKKSHEQLVEDRDSFKVSFDVSKFKPEEITIRSEDGELVVEGKQEVKGDDGYSTRQFVRAYSLPRNIDRDSFTSRLSKEGILSIEAKKLQKPEAAEDFIKIEVDWREQHYQQGHFIVNSSPPLPSPPREELCKADWGISDCNKMSW